jgi:hypothetical protein
MRAPYRHFSHGRHRTRRSIMGHLLVIGMPDPGRVRGPPAGVDMGALYPALWGRARAGAVEHYGMG